MEAIQRLKTVSYVAGGNDTIPLAGLRADMKDGQVPYVKRLEILCDIACTVGATAVTPIQWRNLLSSLTLNVPGGPWGPVNLNGEQLQVLHYTQTAEPIPYASDSAGDTNAAISAGAVTRRVRHIFSFEHFGSQDDPFEFCPPASALKQGTLELSFSAIPTNVTAATISFIPTVVMEFKGEAASVARIRCLTKKLIGPNEVISEKGMLLRLALHNTSADAVAADFTGFRLWAGNDQIVEVNRPLDIRPIQYRDVAKITASALQETFCDPIGGNFVRGINVYPVMPRQALGALPTAMSWRYDFDGAPTAANWELVYAMAYRQSEAHQQAVLGGCGCDGLVEKVGDGGKIVPATHVMIPRGKGGSVLTSDRLNGFTRITAVPKGSVLHSIAGKFGRG